MILLWNSQKGGPKIRNMVQICWKSTYAAEDGVVVFAGWGGTGGNMITIDHGEGLVTKYLHHAILYVEAGQKVYKGQQIGLSGTTGNSTGNHLHFQVEECGKAVDSLIYLQDQGNSERIQLREDSEIEKTGAVEEDLLQSEILNLSIF